MTNKFEKAYLMNPYTAADEAKANTRRNGQTAEVYGYNVITDQDHDILNQGSLDHIHNYFEKKQREHDESKNIIDNEIFVLPKSDGYSVNSVTFIIKITIFIIFIWIMCDFIVEN
jgi:hypothetical protein